MPFLAYIANAKIEKANRQIMKIQLENKETAEIQTARSLSVIYETSFYDANDVLELLKQHGISTMYDVRWLLQTDFAKHQKRQKDKKDIQKLEQEIQKIKGEIY